MPEESGAPPAAETSATHPSVDRRLRRRQRLGLAMIVTGGLIVLAAAWLIVTGLLARSQLQSVRAEVHQLRAQLISGDLGAARTTLASLQSHADRAHDLTTGPVWALASALPDGGEPIRTVRGITSRTDELAAKALPALIDARSRLDPGTLRSADGRIDIGRISAVAPALDRASAVMTSATRDISALSAHTWIGAVDRARSDLLTQLQSLTGEVRSLDLAVHIAPPMLGEDGTKRYFVGFQNDAEARGTGGLPGAFGILTIHDGRPKFIRFENDSRLRRVSTGLNFGADYNQLYKGDETTSLYVNSNVSPHFPYVGQIWAAMWLKASGQHVDGAITLDPTALSYLLAVTGPATLPDHTQVDAGNVVSLTQSTVYAKFGRDVAGRKAYLLAIAKAASTRIVDSHGSTSELVRAAGKALGERRLLIWSADPRVEADLMQTSAAGAIPRTHTPFVGPVVINAGGNKLDYYLDRSLTWQRTGCGSASTVRATITVTNTAPATGLPAYVTERSDRHAYPVHRGDNRMDLEYFATEGSVMDSVTVDGQPGTARSGLERGHPVFIVDVEVPRGQSRTIVFHLTEPASTRQPIVLRQPLVRPMAVAIEDRRCG